MQAQNSAFYQYTDKNMNVTDCDTNQGLEKGVVPQWFLHFTLHVDLNHFMLSNISPAQSQVGL